MKLLMRYATDLGPRTIVVGVDSLAIARAIAESHRFGCGTEDALSPEAFVLEEADRCSLKAHMARHKIRTKKLHRIVARWRLRNTATIKRLPTRLRVASRRT